LRGGVDCGEHILPHVPLSGLYSNALAFLAHTQAKAVHRHFPSLMSNHRRKFPPVSVNQNKRSKLGPLVSPPSSSPRRKPESRWK